MTGTDGLEHPSGARGASAPGARPGLGGMRTLVGAGLIGALGAAATALSGWARSKGLAVTLGPGGMGVYGQLWAFVLYVGSFGSLGIGVGATALVAAKREARDDDGLLAVIILSLLIPGVVATVLMVGAIAGAGPFAPLLIASHRPGLVILAAISIPLVALQVPLQHVIQGFEDVVGQTVAYTIYGAVFAAASITGAVVAGLVGAVIGLAVGNVVLAAAYLVRTRRLLGRRLLRRVPRDVPRREYALTLLRVGGASLAITVVYSLADLAVRTSLLHTAGRAAAGFWFALSLVSVQFIGALAGAMSYITTPLAARAATRESSADVRALLDNSLRLSIIVVVPVLSLIVALRHPLVSLLFSGDFAHVARFLPAQMAGDAFRTFGWALGAALIPLGMTKAWFWIGMSSSVVYGGVGVGLAWTVGLGGAVAAWVVTWGLSFVLVAGILLRRGVWRPSWASGAGLVLTPALLGLPALWPGAVGAGASVAGTMALLLLVVRRGEQRAALGWALALLRSRQIGGARA